MIELVFETHSLSTDNERGIATGWLPGELSEHGPGGWCDSKRKQIVIGATAIELGAPVDALVHGALAPIALEPCDLVDHDDERWGLVWETTMRTAISCCQAAFAHMHDRGGNILFVLPTDERWGAAFHAAGIDPRLLASETGAA